MASSDYRRLISGSDLRGVALAGYGAPVSLTDADAAAAAYAFGHLLKGDGVPRVAIGNDPRLSAQQLKAGAIAGLLRAGCEVFDCGLATTPAMFSATTGALRAHGAIMITASHLPPERNGLKFFTRQGGLTGAQLGELVESMRPVDAKGGAATPFDIMAEYAGALSAFIAPDGDRPLTGMRIALDASNGSGGFFKDVLEKAGATVLGQYLQPDGRFPNHPPNPEDAGAMRAIGAAVLQEQADLGVIFDADCDRAALVDGSGRAVNRDRLIALVAALLLREHSGATIVTDSVTSTGLTDFIRERGGVHRRYKRGYRNVIDEAVRLNAQGVDCPCAIETSGHCALRENRFLDDGAYLIAWLLRRFGRLRQAGRDWRELIADLCEPVEDVEIRIPLVREGFAQDAGQILEAIERAASADAALSLATDSAEGVRVHCPEGGWFMVRQSVHDPVLPVNIQSQAAGGARQMAARLEKMLAPALPLIDIAPLRALITG